MIFFGICYNFQKDSRRYLCPVFVSGIWCGEAGKIGDFESY